MVPLAVNEFQTANRKIINNKKKQKNTGIEKYANWTGIKQLKQLMERHGEPKKILPV